jgi:hypothetical protein
MKKESVILLGFTSDHAKAQVLSRQLPTVAAWVQARSCHVAFVVDKVALGQIPSEYFISPANSHSIDCPTVIIYHLGLI